MKYGLLVMVLGSYSLVAMDKILTNNKSGDEVIEMVEDDHKPFHFKSGYKQKEKKSLDIELQDMEYHDDFYSPVQLDKEKYVYNFLSELPIFKGAKAEKIAKRMEQIETMFPTEYGRITESLSISYKGFQKRAKNNRGICDIDAKDVNDINARIQYALLEIAHENQKIASNNRGEDLAQARRDRIRTTSISVVGLIISVPALTLSIINIIKAFH